MKEHLKTFVLAILAGMCIAIGGTVYLLLENKVIGSALFTVGLFTICTFGYNLYTGKVCYVFDNKPSYLISVAIIWLGNLVGTFATGKLLLATRIGGALAAAAETVCAVKLGDGIGSIFILAIFCNMMIYLGVENFKNNPHVAGKYIALFLGVMVFILCGFEHCIANMYYFTVGGAWSAKALGYLGVMTLGNAVGGVVMPLAKKVFQK